MAQGQICCSYSHKKCKVKYTTKHGTCVSHMLLMTRGYSFYIRIFTILAFVFHCVFACLFILILQNHIDLCWQKQTAKANKKQGQNKKKTNVDSLSTHQSPLKLAETEWHVFTCFVLSSILKLLHGWKQKELPKAQRLNMCIFIFHNLQFWQPETHLV